MPDIYHTLNIKSTADKVFKGFATVNGLDEWWTKTSEADAKIGGEYKLNFSDGYNWKAVVTRYITDKEFELQFTVADDEWINTIVGFELTQNNNSTRLNFYHINWKVSLDNYKFSSYCWAMYLRILKRYIEFDEHVPYEKRLSV